MMMRVQTSSEAAAATSTPAGPGLWACRLQFDINSDALRSEPLEDGELSGLLDEFVELSAEMATRGDVP